MARLDETISAGQAGHISDSQILARKANYIFDVKDFGAVGDGVADDTAAIQAAIDAAAGEPIFFPVGEYVVSSTLDPSAAHKVHMYGGQIERARNGISASNQAATTITFTGSAGVWLIDDWESSLATSTQIGPYTFTNLAFDVGVGNGFRFGHRDETGDGNDNIMIGGSGQRFVFSVNFDGCQIDADVVTLARDSAGTIAWSDQKSLEITKGFECLVDNSSFYGGGTQITLYGCDKPTIQNVRGGQCQVGIFMEGSGTFTVDHTIRGYQIEGYSHAAIVNRGCHSDMSSLRIEPQPGTYDAKLSLSETAAVTSGSQSLTFSASMAAKLFPYLSTIVATDTASGEEFVGLIDSVSGTTVTVAGGASNDFNTPDFTDGSSAIVVYHAAGIVAASPHSSSVSELSYGSTRESPACVYSADRGSLFVSGAVSTKGSADNNYSLICGNKIGQSSYLNAAFSYSGSPFTAPPAGHPMSVFPSLPYRSPSAGDGLYVGDLRSVVAGGWGDLSRTVRRTWLFTPGTSSTSFNNSSDTPIVRDEIDSVTGETAYVWKKANTQELVLADETLPSNAARYVRVRILARGFAAGSDLSFFFADNGGSATTTWSSIGTTWGFFESVVAVPTVWQTTGVSARSLRFATGTDRDSYIAGVSVEEFDTADGGFVAGALQIIGDMNHDGTNAGFYGATPVAQQTGVTVDAAGIHAALVNLGLITA